MKTENKYIKNTIELLIDKITQQYVQLKEKYTNIFFVATINTKIQKYLQRLENLNKINNKLYARRVI